MSAADPGPAAVPRPLRLAAAVLGLQGLGLVIAGIVELIAALTGTPHDRGTATFLGALVIGYGAAVVFSARGLARPRAWAGTPAFLAEFFAVVVAVSNLHAIPAVSAVLLASAVVVVVGLAHPASQRVLIRRRTR